ncbi:hypothetical protein, partial [uncultured Jatrophihabitans sp.]|uniref:hypothetical protein n=1 Tax=uncultured Jatrophihabitans sp. TaxID=1610747 RepID=UPI0035CA396F
LKIPTLGLADFPLVVATGLGAADAPDPAARRGPSAEECTPTTTASARMADAGATTLTDGAEEAGSGVVGGADGMARS